MDRRKFLGMVGGSGAVAASAAASLSTPAIAQSLPTLKWRLAASVPKSLDTVYGGAERVAKRVFELSGGKFEIQTFAANEIVPAFQVLDAVQSGSIELGQSFSYYYVGKDPTFAFDAAVPFGLNTRQQIAWIHQGGGLPLLREFFAKYNIHNIPSGNTGAQMGGWFNREIKTPDDLKGLKMRLGGLGGAVLSRLGAVPQQIPGGEIYQALEKGTIDGAEWVGPYDDEKLGFYKVAKNYYYPGWFEGSTQFSVYVNLERWNSLPSEYKTILEVACADTYLWSLAKYDADNPAALRRLVANGVHLRPYSREILKATFDTTYTMYDEFAASNSNFKKIYDHWKAFRSEAHLWFRVAEQPFDNFVYANALPKKD